MSGSERRRNTRFRVQIPGRVRAECGPDDGHSVRTRDVSTAGAFLGTRAPYPVGTAVAVELTIALKEAQRFALSGAARVDLKGAVIRAEAAGIAVAFHAGYQIRPVAKAEGAP